MTFIDLSGGQFFVKSLINDHSCLITKIFFVDKVPVCVTISILDHFEDWSFVRRVAMQSMFGLK